MAGATTYSALQRDNETVGIAPWIWFYIQYRGTATGTAGMAVRGTKVPHARFKDPKAVPAASVGFGRLFDQGIDAAPLCWTA